MRNALKNEFETPFYSRGYNPTTAMLRKKLAALEGTEDALVCGSGSAAVAIAVLGNLKAGDHVISVSKPYSWTYKLLGKLLARYGVETTFVDGREIDNFRAARKENTRMVFLESPNSMTFEMQDLKAIAEFCREKGCLSVIDNSYATPLFQRPHELGIDLVVHSATKFLNGHSDVVAGVICGSKKHIMHLFANDWMTLGPTLSPHDAWLLIRGLRTLELRVNRSAESAEYIIKRLEGHPKIEGFYYPFAESNPQRELAMRQMSRSSGLFSITIKTDREGIERFCDSLKCFLIACSWGGHESLVFPVAGLALDPKDFNPLIPYNLVRIYVGLEDKNLLLEDLKAALERV